MSSPYAPYQAPKKLERSRSNKVLGGVCGGLAKYLNMDPTLVRILTVVLSLFTGVPIIVYIVALFVIPEEGASQSGPPSVYPPPAQPGGQTGYEQSYQPYPTASPQAAPVPPSSAPPPAREDTVWGSEGAPWEQREPENLQPVPDQPVPAADAPAPASGQQGPESAGTEPASTESTETESTPNTEKADPKGEGESRL